MADVTSKSVTIEWETPISNGGTEITNYIIEKYLNKSSQWSKVVTLDPHCINYCIDNLKRDKNGLIFRVFAENSVGLSAPAVTEKIVLKSHASKSKYFFPFLYVILPIKSRTFFYKTKGPHGRNRKKN